MKNHEKSPRPSPREKSYVIIYGRMRFWRSGFRNGTYWTGSRGIYKKEPCMLNEDKIKLMTELALFEKKHASQMKTVNQYFKSDYISRNLLRGFISYTLCSILLFGMWVLFNVEVVLSSIGMDELKGLAFRGGALYLGGLFLYVVLTIIVYGGRYEYEERMNRIYIAKLKHLDKRYDIHRRARKMERERRGR